MCEHHMYTHYSTSPCVIIDRVSSACVNSVLTMGVVNIQLVDWSLLSSVSVPTKPRMQRKKSGESNKIIGSFEFSFNYLFRSPL